LGGQVSTSTVIADGRIGCGAPEPSTENAQSVMARLLEARKDLRSAVLAGNAAAKM